MQNKIKLPAEWETQSGVMLTWPHRDTDWNYILSDVEACYVQIAKEIAKREKLLIVCKDIFDVKQQLEGVDFSNIIFREVLCNDTWARDHGPISVIVDDEPNIYDFSFNGWGMKFAANHDNQITRDLYAQDTFASNVGYNNLLHFVLEGGSIESDGNGTILSTSKCLLSANRNDHFEKDDIEAFLCSIFGADRFLWLNNGYLSGDDTDSHIDTLARFCNEDTIAYVKCEDKKDEHYSALAKMEEELKSFKRKDGKPYKLVALPMADVCEEDGVRLPATYANFLIINGAILFPTYNSKEKDNKVKEILAKTFPDREIIGIDCRTLIRQHGSLHCVTMQLPKDFLRD